MTNDTPLNEPIPDIHFREFHYAVHIISDDIEALSLIEQVLRSYPNANFQAIASYLSQRCA